MIKKYILPTSLLLMICSCSSPAATSKADTKSASKPDMSSKNKRCMASQPKDVQMWINKMPGPGAGNRPPLHVAFSATTGTPGYQFALKVNRVMESFPVQVVLDLVVTRPTGMVMQVVTENKVNILAISPVQKGAQFR